jgi:enterochelin esterase family protein
VTVKNLARAVGIIVVASTLQIGSAQTQQGGPQSPRLAALAQHDPGSRPQAVDKFWTEMAAHGTPLVEPIANDAGHSLVTFLWRAKGPTENVLLISGLSNNSLSPEHFRRNSLHALAETDIWYQSYRVRNDARFTYQFLVNDPLVAAGAELGPSQARLQPDPLNARHPGPQDQSESLVELPQAPSQPEIASRPGVPKGELTEHSFPSELLRNRRKIWVYEPPSETRPLHLLIVLDGEAYTSEIPTATILDNLLSAKSIPPTLAVFVGNVDGDQPATRARESSCYPQFTRFLAEELLPWITSHYPTSRQPQDVTIAGASRGGLAATCAALEHPERFGNVVSQSGFFVWPDRNWFKYVDPQAAPDADRQQELAWEQYGAVMHRVATTAKVPVRFYLEIGRFENDFHPSPLTATRHLRDVLNAKGYDLCYQEFSGAHTAVNWRGSLAGALRFALSGSPCKIQQ